MGTAGGYGERAWWAWHCHPERDSLRGGPAPLDALSRRTHGTPFELTRGELNKVVFGEYTEPSYRVFRGAALALDVSDHWLWTGEGKAPALPHGVGYPAPWPGPRPSAKGRKGRRKRKATPEPDSAVVRKLQGSG